MHFSRRRYLSILINTFQPFLSDCGALRFSDSFQLLIVPVIFSLCLDFRLHLITGLTILFKFCNPFCGTTVTSLSLFL